MGFWDRFKPEKRATILPNGSVPVSSSNFAEIFGGMFGGVSASGVTVTVDTALGVPAIWAATNFIAGTLAGLPLNVYRKSKDSRKKITTGLGPILHDAVNPEMSSFDWRKYTFERVLTTGRGLTYIERAPNGKVLNLWPLEPSKTKILRVDGRKVYEFTETGQQSKRYSADEVIDIPFMLKADGLASYSPIMSNKNDVGLAIAATQFGSKFFQNGGVPPFAVTGNFQSGDAMRRASDDLDAAVKKAAKEERQALVLPLGLTIDKLGADAEKSQLVELQRFIIEQIARIYSLPPTFLQDLTHGTFSNTEQQDLHFVKHTLKRWIEQTEQELNLKLFGRGQTNLYAEFNVDGLLRGDFKTRMEGNAVAINSGQLLPNEARRRENLPDDPDGNKLMIQGGTVPIANQMALPPGEPNEA